MYIYKYAKSEITLERYDSSLEQCNDRRNGRGHHIAGCASIFYFQTKSWVYNSALILAIWAGKLLSLPESQFLNL